ncbi:hypothetical protein OKW11_001532 [Pseudomonas baetica]|nr:hypothetical protein [Pseudomonas baetica]
MGDQPPASSRVAWLKSQAQSRVQENTVQVLQSGAGDWSECTLHACSTPFLCKSAILFDNMPLLFTYRIL